jgi:phage tail tape-measure protein
VLTKSGVIAELDKQLQTKLSYLTTSLQQAIDSRNSDTKSSAGDKFETSREMAQIEIHKIETEISKTQQFITDLFSKVTQFIITDKGAFLISIPFGKLMVNDSAVFCISNTAPISTYLLDTKIGKSFSCNSLIYTIQ